MDPFTIGAGIVGLGMQLFGGFGASGDAKKIAELNQQIASDERDVNEQKRFQMELSSRRQQLEIMRNTQRLRAQATAAAVNQGANLGSGLQGGLAQITDQGLFGGVGVNQNLEIGRNIFSLNDSISDKKSQISTLQGEQASNSAMMSLGGALVNNAGTIGRIGQFGFGRLTGTSGLYI